MSVYTCTRRLEFDAAHRVTLHESKCRNLHGHRYVVEVTCSSIKLDSCDRVIDFGVIKERLGAWIDEVWDHGTIVFRDDTALLKVCEDNDWKVYPLSSEPTAEKMAEHLFEVARDLLEPDVRVEKIRLYETPNCWADWSRP